MMNELTKIKGIGPKYVSVLNKLDIYSINDLVTHYPFRYEFLNRTDLSSITEEDKVVIDGKIDSTPLSKTIRQGLNRMSFRLNCDSKMVGITIFNRNFLKKQLTIGTNVIVLGKYVKEKNTIIATDIKIGILQGGSKILPVYHCTSGITSKNLNSFINMTLLEYGNEIIDYIPEEFQKKYKLTNKKTCLNIVHNPTTKEKLKEAIDRLKYEELFEFMFKINYLKLKHKNELTGLNRKIDKDKINKFISNIGFELTQDQQKAIDVIINDLEAKPRMNRLLQGDVGSGKTIVSFVALFANFLSGYQGAMMAPTEILAQQHFDNLKEYLKKYDIKIQLLIGSIKSTEKKKIYQELETGKIDIIIGTHALIQDDVKYSNLGLVITDEQHRFGVHQRANLQNKGFMPDVLYMSATPIPRTYALTLFGDMDVTNIREIPKGRQKVETIIKDNKHIKDVLQMMYNELLNGHQIYVIAPLVEENENTELVNVYQLKEKMITAFNNKYEIDIVHGKMKSKDKERTMAAFKIGNIKILISTTVVEVGVDVPNATCIVIFNADRFGLSTLHQLRGRVGRGNSKSTCILISDSDTKRLEIMQNEYDGFKISEEDFKLRGHGDLFGTKQSGDMTFKIADVKQDYNILEKAKEDSLKYLEDKSNQEENIKNIIISSIENA